MGGKGAIDAIEIRRKVAGSGRVVAVVMGSAMRVCGNATDKMRLRCDGKFANVTEQDGLYAGDSGYGGKDGEEKEDEDEDEDEEDRDERNN